MLNETWMLCNQKQHWHLLTLGWTNPSAAVDRKQLEPLALGMLALAD